MMRSKIFGVAAVVMGMSVAGVMGQMSIEPPVAPPSSSSNTPAATTTGPAVDNGGMVTTTTPGASTVPSAQNVLEGLLKDKSEGGADSGRAVVGSGGANRMAESPMAEVAPNAPKATRVREGEMIYNRTGRLMKDEKSGSWVFEFESDGKAMEDPPVTLLPSRLLAAMEDASTDGTVRTRFRVSGAVTEYRGKNYLWVQKLEILRDLNKGIGG